MSHEGCSEQIKSTPELVKSACAVVVTLSTGNMFVLLVIKHIREGNSFYKVELWIRKCVKGFSMLKCEFIFTKCIEGFTKNKAAVQRFPVSLLFYAVN